MPRDGSDDAYEELAKEQYERERARMLAKLFPKFVKRKPGRRCKSCGCEQKYHAGSRGACGNDIEIITSGGPKPDPCACRKFNR